MSFFGFDTSNPDSLELSKKKKRNKQGKKKEVAVAKVFDGDALDEMLEKKYAQEQGLADEFEDEDNMETFKVNKKELEKDFDFSKQSSLQQIEAQMRRPVSAAMSLDQVEAQLRSGPAPANMYPSGMDPSYRPPIQQPIFNGSMKPGAGHIQQPQILMHPGQMQIPMHAQNNLHIQRPVYQQAPGHMQQTPVPMQHLGPGQIQRPMQQLSIGQRPMNPPGSGQIQRPAIPRTIVVGGITVTPIDLTNQEKDAVFTQLKQMQPMAPHIDTLLNTIYSIGGEQENDNLKNLNEIKNVLKLQLDLINRGIFIIRPEVASQLRKSLLQFFQYGESLMISKENAQVSNDDNLAERLAEEIIEGGENPDEGHPEQEVEKIEETVEEPKKPLKILKKEFEKESKKKIILDKKIKVKKEGVEEEGNEIIKFEENDFPALGKDGPVEVDHSGGEIHHVRILPRKGNQKQRRDEQKERMGAQSVLDEKFSILLDTSIPRSERYAGVMRKHEKELIAKIQISQLVTDDPFLDDFYFQMKALQKKKLQDNAEKRPRKKSNKSGKWQDSIGQLVDGKKASGAVISNQMQQQMKRLIESRRALKPRESNTAALEGALGKISAKSNRAPKQSIEVAPSATGQSNPLSSTLSALNDLRYAEEIMDAVISLQDFDHCKPPKDDAEKEEREAAKITALNDLWRVLAPSIDIPNTTPHPLVCSLNRTKGLTAVSRGLVLLDAKQSLGFFSVLFKRIECLHVMNFVLGKESEKVEAFMNSIFPALTSIVNDASMVVIGALMRIILERHNLLWFAKSRVGLVILTMMLSRAELLKQGVVSPEGGQLPEQELGMWSEIYEFMFSSLKGQFPALFSTETSPADEVFVWQFLSAMAVGASGIEHQRVLVTELRENIIQTAKTNHPKALENVNLFLTALGLNIDAAQLAAMSQ